MYSVLNTLSEYTYFNISKYINSYTFVAFFENRRKPSAYDCMFLSCHIRV